MRSLGDTRPLWLALKRYDSLDDFKEAVRIKEYDEPVGLQLRSVYWKKLLLYGDLDTSSWQLSTTSSRSAYESLKARFVSDRATNVAADSLGDTPKDTSLHNDETLLAEIKQDVERCMPSISFFQDSSTQRILTDVLFVFCKLNPDLSYRQGMHELAAPILWVVDQDAVDIGQSSKLMGEDALMCHILNVDYIEHDTFTLFSQVMQNAKKFYEQTSHTATENPLVSRSLRITSTILPQVDPELAAYLDSSGIAPQIFLIRWIRLLFGREFEFADVLTVWDIIFAEDVSLEIVDYICIAMLLRIRWELLDSTSNEALSVLLHYPPLDHDLTAQTLAIDALALRANTTVSTGNRLVVKYTGRAMLEFNKPSTPPAFQRNITSFSGMDAFRKSLRGKSNNTESAPSPQINFEAMLQSTAQNILNRGEQLGIGKAVRSAIDDVHRKAQEIRESHASSPGWRQRPRSSLGLTAKIKALEERNSQLAQLLDGAVSQLWDVQKIVAESSAAADDEKTDDKKLDLEKFSVAIGQVQYVQVYLQDSTLPLAEAETEPAYAPAVEGDVEHEASSITATDKHRPDDGIFDDDDDDDKNSMLLPSTKVEGLLDPSAFDETFEREVEPTKNTEAQEHDFALSGDTPSPESTASTKRLSVASRPPLAESAYSWMLGQPKDDSFGSAKSGMATNADRSGTLFSDSRDGEILVTHKTRKGIRPKKKYATPAVSTDVNLNFDA